MLVLSRKKNERIVIAGVIEIVVVDICGGKVKLGIECPKEIPVHRSEVHDRIVDAQRTGPNLPLRDRLPRTRPAVRVFGPSAK